MKISFIEAFPVRTGKKYRLFCLIFLKRMHNHRTDGLAVYPERIF